MKCTYLIRLSDIRSAVADTMRVEARDFGLDTDQKCRLITRINVPVGFRGNGIGSELLSTLLNDADSEDVILLLSIQPYGDMTYDQLLDWYTRHGFEPTDDEVFVRFPNAGDD